MSTEWQYGRKKVKSIMANTELFNILDLVDSNATRDVTRREALQQLGAFLGVGALVPEYLTAIPKPVPAGAVPKKTGAVRVRLVFAAFKMGKDNHQRVKTWPHIDFDFTPVFKNVADTLNARIPEVAFDPVVVSNKEEGAKLVKADEAKGGIQGYLVIQMNNWVEALSGIYRSGKPTLFCSFPYSGIGWWLMANANLTNRKIANYEGLSSLDFNDTVGFARAFAKLKDGSPADCMAAARAYRLAHTPVASKTAPKEGPLACATPEEALAAVKGMKILSVQGTSAAKRKLYRETFGIEIENVSYAEVNAAAGKVDDAVAKSTAQGWLKGARFVGPGVSEASVFGAAKVYHGMKALLAERKAAAITIDCLGGCYHGKLMGYPCLGFMQLQDEGLMGTCENDIESLVTMLLFRALTKGRMGYISDPCIDAPRRSIVFAHCVSTRRFFGPQGPEEPYEILTHCADREGASSRAFAPVGYPVTTVKLNPQLRKLAVQSGIITANDRDDRGCRTKMVVEVRGDDYENIYLHWQTFGWHRVTFVGDFKADVEKLAQKIGFQVLRED